MPKQYPPETLRHSFAHVMAAAVQTLYPKAQFGVGPVIENGFYYDIKLPETLTESALANIEKEIMALIAAGIDFTRKELPIAAAIRLFKKKKQPFKVALLNDLNKKGTTKLSPEEKEVLGAKKVYKVSIYETGDFVDLCHGPHVASTGDLDPAAFKLTKISGAYWRGSEKNPQLTRIYGAAFATKEELKKYLWQQEEAKKRDHRVLGEKLKLFTFSPLVGPGLPLWLPHGTAIRDAIEERAKKVEAEWGYQRVTTPHIAKEDLYRTSGHIPYYLESMYPPMKLDDGNYYLKAMNCPHTHLIYKAEPRSYRDLPIRYAEYGTLYRYELSGTLAGLLRTRGFTQNDAHIYCREDQAEEEFLNVMKLHEYWYKRVFGITNFFMRLSLPSKDKKKFANAPEGWKKSVAMVRSAMRQSGLPYVEAEGEAAFYGPKVDFQIKSIIGREETASTNQLDFLAAKRFNLSYIDNDGKEKPVYVIHRAPLGSHERFIAFLIEHYAGAFPMWLAPVQITLLPINDKNREYVANVAAKLKERGIRIETDERNESIGKKIRDAELQKIPYLLVVGDREAQNKTVAVRERGKGDLGAQNLDAFIKRVL